MFKFSKVVVFVLCLVPVTLLVNGFLNDELGANPFEVLTRETGEWTLRFLILTLFMTPLKVVTGSAIPIRFRRMFGLYSFFYAGVHLLTYLWLDHFFDWDEIVTDIIKRPYITLGMLAFILLIPLAVTSTKPMMRRIGKHWKSLHKLVYVIVTLGVIHFTLLVKADLLEPVIYGSIVLLLLLMRTRWVVEHLKR